MMLFALLKKDFLIIKKYLLFMIIIVIALPIVLATQSSEASAFTSTMAFTFEVIYAEFLISRYLAMKEYQYPKAASFLSTLPYTRGMQIVSKYLLYLIIFAFCCIAYWIDTLFVSNLAGINLNLIIPILFMTSILYSIYMPVQYVFGYEKSKLVFMFLLIAFPLLISRTNAANILVILSRMSYPIMLIVAIGALFLSLMVSINIFNQKEL